MNSVTKFNRVGTNIDFISAGFGFGFDNFIHLYWIMDLLFLRSHLVWEFENSLDQGGHSPFTFSDKNMTNSYTPNPESLLFPSIRFPS